MRVQDARLQQLLVAYQDSVLQAAREADDAATGLAQENKPMIDQLASTLGEHVRYQEAQAQQHGAASQADHRFGLRLLWSQIVLAVLSTVALGVPLYTQRQRIRALWRPIAVALLVGCVVGLTGAMGIAWVLGGSWQTLVSLAPKSATIPIALPMAERLGGEPSLAAVAVAVAP